MVRASNLGIDSRTQRIIRLFLSLGWAVRVICWDRTPSNLAFEGGEDVEIVSFRRIAPHGRHFRNLISLFLWQIFVLRKTLLRKGELQYGCDLESYFPLVLNKYLLRNVLLFDQFDPFSTKMKNPILKRVIDHVEKRAASFADATIVPSIERQAFFPFGTKIIENIPDSNWPRTPNLNEENILVYIGTLQSDRFLEEAMNAVELEQSWTFWLAGQGPLSDQIARRSKLNKRIVFLGEIPHHNVPEIAGKSSLMLATYDPSLLNNRLTASNKLGEAAVLGLPIIATRGTKLGEQVAKFNMGFVVNPGDSFEIIKILRSFREVSAQTDFQKNADTYLLKHSWQAQASIFSDILRQLGLLHES